MDIDGAKKIKISQGSVGIKNGSIGVSSLPSITGTVDIRTGSVGISHLPSITGSIDVRGGSVDVDIAYVIGHMSTNNSTTTPLGIDGVFTGTADDIKDFSAINISIFADQDSATDGLSIEWSQDGTNWDEKMNVDIEANKVESYEFGVRARYFRLVYTNGGTAQGAFRLQVMYHPQRTRQGARCLCVDIDSREFAPTRRAILAAKKPNEDYTNIHATTAGNLKIAIEEYDTSLPAGSSTIGSVGIIGQPIAIHGSIGVKEGGGRGSVAIKNQYMPFLGSVSSSLGSAASWSKTGSISGFKNIVGYAYFTHVGSVYVKQSSGSPFDVVSGFSGTAGECVGLSVEVVAPRTEVSVVNTSGTANTIRTSFYKRVI